MEENETRRYGKHDLRISSVINRFFTYSTSRGDSRLGQSLKSRIFGKEPLRRVRVGKFQPFDDVEEHEVDVREGRGDQVRRRRVGEQSIEVSEEGRSDGRRMSAFDASAEMEVEVMRDDLP